MMNIIIQNEINSLKVGIAVLFIGFIFIISLVVYLNDKLYAEKIKTEKQKNLIIENRLLEQGLNNIKLIYKNNSKNFHDFRNHLEIINMYTEKKEYKKLKEYLLSIDINSSRIERYNTGNEIIDMILDIKSREFKKYKIIFTDNIYIDKNFKINKTELCSLLSNLLDNAIAACKNSEVRRIDLLIKNKGNIIILVMSNSTIENPISQKFATKKGKNHGWGMKIINDIVEKYDGKIEYDYKNNIFKIQIILLT